MDCKHFKNVVWIPNDKGQKLNPPKNGSVNKSHNFSMKNSSKYPE